MKLPIDAVLAITYRCNSRCKMCYIWKKPPKKELKPEDYLKLPETLKDINISGGEPFLRNDLIEIVKNIKISCPKAGLIISTNGFLHDLIYRQMKKILEIDPTIGVAVSLDGIGKIHNEIRGIDNGYQKVLKTIKNLKSLGIKNIKIAFTVSQDNIKEISRVYRFALRQKLEFSIAAAQNSEHYFGIANKKIQNKEELKNQFNKIISQELKTNKPKNLGRAYFIQGLGKFILKQKRVLPCKAASDFFFLDPQGNVYPCPVFNSVIGNIQEKNFKEIWQSAKAEEIRRKVKNCQNCWMICTARTSIKRHLLKVFAWIVKSKINKANF